MRLEELSEDHKTFLLETRAKNRNIPETMKLFYEIHPDATRYKLRTFRSWFYEPDTKIKYKELEDKIRKEARNYSFANKDSRLLAQIEVSEKLLYKIRELDATDKQFPILTRELRENLKFIKEEVDPFNLEDEHIRSAYDSFMERAKGTPFENFFSQPDSTATTPEN